MLNKGLVFVDAATVASYFTEIWELTTQQDSAFYLVGGLHRPEWDEMVSFPTEAHLPREAVVASVVMTEEVVLLPQERMLEATIWQLLQ